MAKIRTFICIELPEDIRQKLSELTEVLKFSGSSIRWVRPNSIHLTLKFLGDIDKSEISNISATTSLACEDFEPFRIQVATTGAFPNFNRPRVFWVGIADPDNVLSRLQERIEENLANLGYPKENRKFSPHLTLGRVKSQSGVVAIAQQLQKLAFDAGTFLVKEIVVMKSELKPTGAVYTPMNKINLISKNEGS